ncbi:mycofactocin precursor MftA [Actinomadura madurae]
MRNIRDTEQPRDADADDGAGTAEAVPDLLDEELLVEEVSIDGMCGVY